MAPSEQYLPLTPKKLMAMFRGKVKGWFKERDTILRDIRPLSTNDN